MFQTNFTNPSILLESNRIHNPNFHRQDFWNQFWLPPASHTFSNSFYHLDWCFTGLPFYSPTIGSYLDNKIYLQIPLNSIPSRHFHFTIKPIKGSNIFDTQASFPLRLHILSQLIHVVFLFLTPSPPKKNFVT